MARGMNTEARMETVFLVGLLIGLCKGLNIKLIEVETSNCLKPSTQIICESTPTELQAAGNKMMINHGDMTLATCNWDTGTCSIMDMHYNATIDGSRAILIPQNMDKFYKSNKWLCYAGDKTAKLILKFFRTEDEDSASRLKPLTNTSIVHFLTLICVLLIPIVFGIGVCKDCIRKKQQGAKSAS